jgi:hypothetical protein
MAIKHRIQYLSPFREGNLFPEDMDLFAEIRSHLQGPPAYHRLLALLRASYLKNGAYHANVILPYCKGFPDHFEYIPLWYQPLERTHSLYVHPVTARKIREVWCERGSFLLEKGDVSPGTFKSWVSKGFFRVEIDGKYYPTSKLVAWIGDHGGLPFICPKYDLYEVRCRQDWAHRSFHKLPPLCEERKARLVFEEHKLLLALYEPCVDASL